MEGATYERVTLTDELVGREDRPATGGNLWADPTEERVSDPRSGVTLIDLSHPFGSHTPVFPGYKDIDIRRGARHASHGVMTQRVVAVLHVGTHVNAPIHLIPGGPDLTGLPLSLFFGSGVVLDVPKGRWETIEPADLEAAGEVRPNDIVLINTGWHRYHSDSQRYFGEGPGLGVAAAQWLLDHGAKLVGVDTATVDHPMATSLGYHRNGPLAKAIPRRYEEVVGSDPREDFPDWNPAHKLLLGAGVPTIENVGGAVDEVGGRRVTIQAFPWNLHNGDACVVRLTAITDPSGDYRIGKGE
ncbi:MAG: cyclase family protein [Solirubrobacterales bacterium]